MKNKLVVISGPSGVGKSTIIKLLIKECPQLALLVSATTRQKRPNEIDGVHYHFINKDDFLEAVKTGDIPEYRHIKELDVYYGTYLPDLRNKISQGKVPVADVDIIGARYFKQNYDAVLIFILPPDFDSLVRRIKKRKDNMSEEEFQKRLEIAKREINEDSKEYDYKVVNEEGKIHETVEKIKTILKKHNIC